MANEKKTETAEIYDPMKEMVTVRLPRATGDEENSVFVGLNGKGYRIERGVPVTLPKPVADILETSERAKERQAAFIAEQEEKARQADIRAWR